MNKIFHITAKNLKRFFLIAEKTEAMRDAWLIGDKCLTSIFPKLQNLKIQAIIQKKTTPYLHKQFNLTLYSANKDSVRSGLARIVNSIAEGFNSNVRLPTFIIIIMDKDFVENMRYLEYGIKKMLEDGLKWVMNQIRRMIDIRINNLMSKRPGAILFTPRIIWVKMLNRPFTAKHAEQLRVDTMSKRKMYNDLVATIIPTYEKAHVLQVAAIMELPHKNYDGLGNLSEEGKAHYWKELDHYCKKLDRELFNSAKKTKSSK